MINRYLILFLVAFAGYTTRAVAISGPSSVCLGATITLTDTLAGGTWSSDNTLIAIVDGSGNVTGVAPGWATIIYSVAGTDYMATVTVDSLPDAGIITGPDSVCAWAPQLYVSSLPGGIWRAHNEKGAIDTFGLFTGATAGVDTIYYISSNTCGRDTASHTVRIIPLANAGFILGDASVCVGDTLRLSNNVRGGQWFLSRETTIRLTDTSATIGVAPGMDTVFYRVENSCGVATTFKLMFVTAYPDAGSITGPTVLCVGQTITLTDSAKNGVWRSDNSNVSISGTLQVTAVAAGNTVISYKVINICAADSALWPITINPVPEIPAITRSGNSLVTATGLSSYQWINKSGPIAGANSNTYTVDALGSYYCLVSNSLGCNAMSFPQTITNLECPLSALRLYPNPATDIFHIEWCRPVKATITDINGKTLHADNINEVDMRSFPAGNYKITIFDMNGNKLEEQQITKLHR